MGWSRALQSMFMEEDEEPRGAIGMMTPAGPSPLLYSVFTQSTCLRPRAVSLQEDHKIISANIPLVPYSCAFCHHHHHQEEQPPQLLI